MSSVIIAGNTSGTITLDAPAVAGTTTLTLPTTSGTVLTSASTTMPASSVNQAAIATGVVGKGPCFSAYNTASFTSANGVNTKVPFNTIEWDTNSNYDTTNYRFTPNVTGYYQVNARVTAGTMSGGQVIVYIFKNGGEIRRLGQQPTASGVSQCPQGSALVYLNGSTDYIDAYVYQSTGSTQTFLNNLPAESYFQATLVRAA
jgi:hypothetical protein